MKSEKYMLEEEIIVRVAQKEIIECPNCGKILYIAINDEDKENE